MNIFKPFRNLTARADMSATHIGKLFGQLYKLEDEIQTLRNRVALLERLTKPVAAANVKLIAYKLKNKEKIAAYGRAYYLKNKAAK